MFLRAGALLPFISASLHLRGFCKTQRFLERHLSTAAAQRSAALPGNPELTARMVRAAVRHGLGHPTCLEESLTLWWLLARQGIASDLRIGVRKSAEKFEAHAWVEYQGAALNEAQALHEHYAAFDAALASMPSGPP